MFEAEKSVTRDDLKMKKLQVGSLQKEVESLLVSLQQLREDTKN